MSYIDRLFISTWLLKVINKYYKISDICYLKIDPFSEMLGHLNILISSAFDQFPNLQLKISKLEGESNDVFTSLFESI